MDSELTTGQRALQETVASWASAWSPVACRSCPHVSLCPGGCPRDRTWNADGSIAGSAYFGEAYREFYDYAHERFTQRAAKVRERSVIEHAQPGRPLPERNDPCGGAAAAGSSSAAARRFATR